LVFAYLEQTVSEQLDKKIDQGTIDNNSLVEIQLPLNMPYMADKDYEPATGQTNVNGMQYHFVKRKISGNILYLLCIPNLKKTELEQSKNEIAGAGTNKDRSGKTPKTWKYPGTDFFENNPLCKSQHESLLINSWNKRRKFIFQSNDFSAVPGHPPEAGS
jgi:hypothetical protein